MTSGAGAIIGAALKIGTIGGANFMMGGDAMIGASKPPKKPGAAAATLIKRQRHD